MFKISLGPDTYIHTYIHKLYLSSDFSVAYIASISDPKKLQHYNIILINVGLTKTVH